MEWRSRNLSVLPSQWIPPVNLLQQSATQEASAPPKPSAHRKKATGPSNAAKRTQPPLTTVRVPRPDDMADGSTSAPPRKTKTPATSEANVAAPSRPNVPIIHIPATIVPPQVAAASTGDPVKRPTHAGKTILVVPPTTDNLKRKSPKEDEDDIEDFSDEDGGDMEIDDEPPRKSKKTQKKKRRVVSAAYVEISDEDEGGGPTMTAAVTTRGNGKKVAPPTSDITLLKALVPCDRCQLFDESCWTFMEKPRGPQRKSCHRCHMLRKTCSLSAEWRTKQAEEKAAKVAQKAATAAKRAAKKKARQSTAVDEAEMSGEASRNVRKDKGKAKAKAKSKEVADPPKRSVKVKVKVKQEDPSPMEWHSTSKFL